MTFASSDALDRRNASAMMRSVRAFVDRTDAGRQLARLLEAMRADRVVVLGLARGGVPVALEVARGLEAPLEVLVIRKIGVPFQPEVAMGAIGEGGVRVVDREVMTSLGVSTEQFRAVERSEGAELERRLRRFRADRTTVSLEGRTVVIVDDGVATGSTARAACQVARSQGAKRIVLAVPVAAAGAISSLRADTDELIALQSVDGPFAVGLYYDEFDQTTDEEVIEALAQAASRGIDSEVTVDVVELELPGHLTVPVGASMVVIFVHGSGSSRFSVRNRAVADSLHGRGLGTLLFDLLSEDEGDDRANVFDVNLLTFRLSGATRWLRQRLGDATVIGYFGASTGAAAALIAASDPSLEVRAVVSRGGRVDLAGGRTASLRAPTLLIVGGDDSLVLTLNAAAMRELTCEYRLEVVAGATHLFEEPGALEAVSRLAGEWFESHLDASVVRPSGIN